MTAPSPVAAHRHTGFESLVAQAGSTVRPSVLAAMSAVAGLGLFPMCQPVRRRTLTGTSTRAAIPPQREEIMNNRHAALAASALTLGAVTLGALEASADVKEPTRGYASSPMATTPPPWPDEGVGYPQPEPKSPQPVAATSRTEVPMDHNVDEVLQAAASALGGAGLALGGTWLYRRHRAPAR